MSSLGTKIGKIIIIGLAVLLICEAIGLLFFVIGKISLPRKVAVVEVVGTIMESSPIIRELHTHWRDRRVAAIVIRISTAGGSMAAVQEIYREIERIRAKKKVVASLGSVGTSGGYYLAIAADEIFANPGTLVGNIGALINVQNFKDLLQKVGVEYEVVKSGKYKDIGSPLRKMTQEEREVLQRVIDDAHAQFLEAIKERRSVGEEVIEAVRRGEIFTGRQALNLGLIDRLGNLDDAIERAAKLAGVEGRPEVIRPRRPFRFFPRHIFGFLPSYFLR
jgi:protease-4